MALKRTYIKDKRRIAVESEDSRSCWEWKIGGDLFPRSEYLTPIRPRRFKRPQFDDDYIIFYPEYAELHIRIHIHR